MKKILALALVLNSYYFHCMDSQKAPVIVLPSPAPTPRGSLDETPGASCRTSFDTDSDWSRECSPRQKPPALKSKSECYNYLKELDSDNRKLYYKWANLKNIRTQALEPGTGLGLYLAGVANQEVAPYVGTLQYFLSENIIEIAKTCLDGEGLLVPLNKYLLAAIDPLV